MVAVPTYIICNQDCRQVAWYHYLKCECIVVWQQKRALDITAENHVNNQLVQVGLLRPLQELNKETPSSLHEHLSM